MPLERELKLTIHGPVPNLQILKTLAGHELRYLRTVAQHNRYFDSTDLKLSAARCGFRIRETKHDLLATFKFGGSLDANGFQQREELEHELVKPFLSQTMLHDLPSEFQQCIEKHVPISQLGIVAEIRNSRQEFLFREIGELVLDHAVVQLANGEQILEFHELEIELLPNTNAEVFAAIVVELQAMAQFLPSSASKLGRALQALKQQVF